LTLNFSDVANEPGTLALSQIVEGQLHLSDLSPPSSQDNSAFLEESPTLQAACEVELLNTEKSLEVLLKMHPQLFVILISPSVQFI
jgi:hypothetical protein